MDATTLDILNLSLEIFFDIVFYFLLTNAFKRIKIESKFESSVVI